MVDPVDLALLERAVHRLGQVLRRLQVVAERLFDHDPGESRRVVQAGLAHVVHDHREEARGRGQVEHAVALGAVALVDPLEPLAERTKVVDVVEAAALVVQRVGERGPVRLVDRRAREALERRAGEVAVVVVGHLAAGIADDREAVRQEAAHAQVVDRGQELAVGQVARRAEDDEHGRNGGPAGAQPGAQGIGRRVADDLGHVATDDQSRATRARPASPVPPAGRGRAEPAGRRSPGRGSACRTRTSCPGWAGRPGRDRPPG